MNDNDHNDSRRFIARRVGWMVVGLAISIAVSWFVPFPYSLGIMVPAFLAMAYLVRWQAMKKMGDNTAFGWSSALRAGQAPAKLEYYCMVCGTKHDLQSCPKCGSRAVRAG